MPPLPAFAAFSEETRRKILERNDDAHFPDCLLDPWRSSGAQC